MWVDEYWEQFHIFTDNIKNDVIKNIFYIRCRDSGPIFYLEWWKLDNFLFSHFDFNYYLIIFFTCIQYFILASEVVAS